MMNQPLPLLILIVLFGLCHASESRADEEGQPVTDVDYGVVLYDFYQGDYFNALTQIEVARLRNGIEHQGIDPTFIEAGMYLSFGLEQQGAQAFETLLSSNDNGEFPLSLAAQAKIWFHLGKIRYQMSDWDGANAAFKQVNEELSTSYTDEFAYFRIMLMLKSDVWLTNDDEGSHIVEEVEELLESMSQSTLHNAYVQYNIAMAYTQQGMHSQASDILATLGSKQDFWQPEYSVYDNWFGEEYESDDILVKRDTLLDRIYLALGYSYLEQGLNFQSMEAFRHVRLKELDTDAALLGFGWAALNDKKFLTAAEAWKRLTANETLSPYALEALIAVPYSFEKLQANERALRTLEYAEQRLSHRLVELRQDQLSVQSSAFFEQFVDIETWAEQHASMTAPSEVFAPSTISLNNFYASKQVQGRLVEYRDLKRLGKQLEKYMAELEHFQLMLNNRAFARADRLAKLDQVELGQRLPRLKETRNKLAQLISESTQTGDGQTLANSEQRAFLSKLTRAKHTAERLDAAGKLNQSQRKRLERVEGVIAWQLANNFVDAKWQSEKALAQVDNAISAAETQQSSLLDAMVSSPDFEALQIRIDDSEARVMATHESVIILQQQIEAELMHKSVENLQLQQAQAERYLTQTRLAIVRLNDAAYQREQLRLNPGRDSASVANDEPAPNGAVEGAL